MKNRVPANAGGRVFPVSPEGNAPPEFGERRSTIEILKLDLTSARNSPVEVALGGEWIWAVEAKDATDKVEIRLHDRTMDPIPFNEGTFLKAGPFNQIYIENTAQTNAEITLVVGTGDTEVANPGRLFRGITLSEPSPAANTLDSIADQSIPASSTAEVIASNANRRAVKVQNLSANSDPIRVADSNAGSTRGIELNPGESITIETEDAVSVHNTGSASQDVAAIEVKEI